jgi:alpha-1,3-rhamnosyl/mannosyltransferase
MQHVHFIRGAHRKGCDLYHEPNFFPYRSRLPTVTTIHDLSPIRFPETHTEQSRRIWRKLLPDALKRSRLILTDSEFIRAEILELLGVPPERVRAIHLGVSEQYRELGRDELAARLSPLGLAPGRYVLAVGTLEPRKNLVSTLEAYRKLPDSMARAHPLVIAGLKGWLTEELQRRLAGLEAEGKVRVLGYVSAEALVALYGGARLLVYPSLYEGFGLPPLEAMACGTPVVVSNRASLPEVVGEAGTQVDAHDVAAIADAMARLVEDASHWRRMREAGLARARQFTWRRCAEATLDAYRAAAA